MRLLKTRTHHPHKSGFTLIELVIYMGLLSVFMFVLTDIFINSLELQTQTQATSEVEQDGRYILNRVIYDVGRSTSITTPASLGTQSTSLVLVIGGVNYTYALNGSNLLLTNNNGTNNLNTVGTTVSGLTFSRFGNSGGKNTIQLSFTLTSVATPRSGVRTKTFSTTVGLR